MQTMILLKISFFSLVGLCASQFIPLGGLGRSKELPDRKLISIARDYKPNLNDCPHQYYQYGGKFLASSAAFGLNLHHKFSHFVALTNQTSDAFCNGILISDSWVLTNETCKNASFARAGFTRDGQINNFTLHAVKSFKVKDSLALLQLDTVDFNATTSSACLMDEKFEDVYYLDGSDIKNQLTDGLKAFQDELILEHKLVPFVSLDVANFSSYISWIEEETKLNFTPKICGSRYYETRLYEKYYSRESNQLIPLDALLQGFRNREYRVEIYDNEEYKCAGVLITDKYLATVASCGVEKGFLVKFDNEDQKFLVEEVTINPKFNNETLENDIAVVRINSTPSFNDGLYPACIPEYEIEDINAPNRQTGKLQIYCGYTECFDDFKSEREKVVLIISNLTKEEDCKHAYQETSKTVDYKSQFCSGNHERLVPDTCQNDIGGPIGRQIFYNGRFFNFVFGLNSFGKDCGCNFPTISTRLSAHRDWMTEIIGLGKAQINRIEESLETRVEFCVTQNLSDIEVTANGYSGVAFNNSKFIIYAGNDSSNVYGTIISSYDNETGYLPSDCLWTRRDEVPFLLSIPSNGTLIAFNPIFSTICETIHNITLVEGEFCVENLWTWDVTNDVPIGTAVWHSIYSDSEQRRTLLVGLVKSTQILEDGKLFAVVKVLGDELNFGTNDIEEK